MHSNGSGSHLILHIYIMYMCQMLFIFISILGVHRTCSRSMAVRYARKWLERTLDSVSTYALRTSPSTSWPCRRRKAIRYLYFSSTFCCRIWMLVLGFLSA